MNHRILIALVALFAAAGPAQAVPLPAELLDRLSDPSARSVFTEPFSTQPPLELRTAVRDRLSSAAVVHLNMVVLLVDFVDNPANTAVSTIAHFDSLLFSRGIHPTGSMADYYDENSNGRLVLNGIVKGWYRLPDSYGNYVSNQAGRGLYPKNSQGMVRDAVLAADPDINFALFDNDGPDGVADTIDDDQHVDLLMVIHAGPGGEGASFARIQSVAWILPAPLSIDGVNVQVFATAPEDATLGVVAHETGHLFGLPDLYDLTGSSFGLGTWTLMSGGWSLNGARTPVHLDPWCKSELGFVDVVDVISTLDNVTIDPVETGGRVYRMTEVNTSGLEYFLVENRRRIGFDSFLPGEGLLVYHVNELIPTNNNSPRYLVGLEQADGLYQLENLFGNPSFGDAGDPYTETTPAEGFGRFTVPNSRNQAGGETGVTVYKIRGPDELGRMTANLRSVRGPTLRIDTTPVKPVDGDGDLFIEAGETFDVELSLVVQGGTVHDVVVEIESSDPLAVIQSAPALLGDLTTGTHAGKTSLRVGVGAGVPRDPYGLGLRLKVSYRDEIAARKSFSVAVGQVVGLANDFEASFAGFIHRSTRNNFLDLWRPGTAAGREGPHAWHCGNDEGGFQAAVDAILETPLFIIPPDGRLTLDHLVDIPRDTNGVAVAGAFVEIAVNGSEWTQITPTSGYDTRYFSTDSELSGRFIFTGGPAAGAEPEWETLTFDLSGYSGGAIARFRFFSTRTMEHGLGWWIDNVKVESAMTPVRLVSLAAVRSGTGVLVTWDLAGEDDLSGLVLSRARERNGAFERLTEGLLPASSGSLVDPDPGEGSPVYRLEAIHRNGTTVPLGQLEASARPPAILTLTAWPNPARGPVALEFTQSETGPIRLVVYDALGRPVRRIVDAALPAGHHVYTWDRRDEEGRSVPAGVYFYRLERRDGVVSRKLVVGR